MGMKILILLSLVAICLAKRQNGWTAAAYPGQPNAGSHSHSIRGKFGGIGLLNPERAQEQSDQVSSEESHKLRNPNRRDVKIGNFPALGFFGKSEKAKHGNDISSNGKTAAPTAKQEESSTNEENSAPAASQGQFRRPSSVHLAQQKYFIMGYGREQSSSSSSESAGQSSESAAASNQQESSSSEENAAPADKNEESSSSEESGEPAVNLESPLLNESDEATTTSNDIDIKVETSSSDSSDSAQSTSESEEVDAEINVKPLLVAKRHSFVASAPRKQAFSFKPMGHSQTASSSKENVPGSRPIREIDNFPDLKLSNANSHIREPMGQIKGNTQRRGKLSAKK